MAEAPWLGWRNWAQELAGFSWAGLTEMLASAWPGWHSHSFNVAMTLGVALLALLVLVWAWRRLRRPRRVWEAWPQQPLHRVTRAQRLFGWVVLGLFFGFGGAWAWLAPLASAAIAPGVVSPEGKRKTIQHLEGGIISTIHIKEGSTVQIGDPLVTLENVRAKADLDVLLDQYTALLGAVVRLEAMQAGATALVFPAELDPSADPDVGRLLATQRELFEAHLAVAAGRAQITVQRVAQLEAENEGLTQQIEAATLQLQLIDEEIGAVQTLLDKGLERRPRLLALQRAQAEIRGQQAALQGRIAGNRERMAQARLEQLTAEQQDRQTVNGELDDARKRLDDVRNRLPSSRSMFSRTVIRAPIVGKVVELRATTVGGIVRPGEPILDIMPSSAELVIDARVGPGDIKDVRPHLAARVVLTSYPQRNLPIIHGAVREVSADRLVDEHTGQPYFLAQIAVDHDEIANLQGDVALLSGMPAEVMIVTGESTFLDYLLRPLYDAFRRAFRET